MGPPSNLPPVIKNTPRTHDREPVPPPITNTPMIQNSVDDEIQEVVPVKSEPRDPPAPAAVPDEELYRPHPQPHVQTSQALTPADDQSLSYPEENYEEYQYGEDQGYEGTMMGEMGMDGNKGFLEVDSGYQCAICGKICKYKNTIKRHIVDQHTENNSALQCVFCMKIYKNKNSLDQHRYKDHREQVMNAAWAFWTSCL